MSKNEKNVKNIPLTDKNVLDTIHEGLMYCYGVKGLVTYENKKGKKEEDLYIHIHHDMTYSVKVHVILVPGVKITETLRSCQKTLKFFLEHKFPKALRYLDVYGDELSSEA